MVRKLDWEPSFLEQIEKHNSLSFEWGVSDCLVFSADCFFSVWGFDFIKESRGLYSSEQRAYPLLASFGYSSLFDLLCTKLGNPLEVVKASRGDVLMLDQKRNQTVAICDGVYGICKTEKGLKRLPLTRFDFVWKGDLCQL